MLSEVNARPEHSTDVCMPFIKTFLHDGIYKWAAMEQHTFTGLMSIFIGNLLPTVNIAFPEFAILYFLYLKRDTNVKRKTLERFFHYFWCFRIQITRIMLYRLK